MGESWGGGGGEGGGGGGGGGLRRGTNVESGYQCSGSEWTSLVLQEDGEEGVAEDKDKRVTVIETSTGKKITGEDAPLKSELEKWLKEHPGYVVVCHSQMILPLTHKIDSNP